MKRFFRCCLLTALFASPAISAQAQTTCLPNGSESYKIPFFTNEKNGFDPALNGYTVHVSIDGGQVHSVQVDTGSSGLLVPAMVVPAKDLNAATQCSDILYTSSGSYIHGRVVTAPVTLGASDGAGGAAKGVVTTEAMPLIAADCACEVVAADKATTPPQCSAITAGNCAILNKTSYGTAGTQMLSGCHTVHPTFGMMGVGFDRGGSVKQNTFLQLPGIAKGSVHAGYIIPGTASGLAKPPLREIQLGLTSDNTKRFQWTAKGGATNSQSPKTCVTLTPQGGGKSQTVCGTLLTDTGIAEMLIAMTQPEATALGSLIGKGSGKEGDIIVKGTKVEVSIPDGPSPILTYNFTATEAPPANGGLPAYVGVRVHPNASGYFINTGRAPLKTNDYAYDAGCGAIGFRPTAK